MTRGRALAAGLGLLLALAPSRALAADDFTLRAFVQPSGRVSDTTQIQLVIQVQGTSMPEVSVGRLPALKNLRVVSGPMTSSGSSFELNNFQMQRSAYVNLLYTLMPVEAGPAEIPPIEIRIHDSVRMTQPIRLEVIAGPSGPSRRSTGRRGEETPGDREEEGEEEADLFLKAELSAREVWEGQPVTLALTFYAGLSFIDLSLVDRPSLSSFWSEELPVQPQAERYRATVEGRSYVAYPLARLVLVPTSAGEFKLEPFAVEVTVPRQGPRDLFSQFFGSRHATRILRKSAPLGLRVRPLAAAGRPADFTGAVGAFRLRASLDRSETQVNDAVALRATVEGEGSLQAVEPPRLPPSPDLKVFEPRVVESKTSYPEGRMVSRKTWEWVIVPLAPGDAKLPPVRFIFFDPATGGYGEAAADPLVLLVRHGPAPQDETAAQGEVRVERRDIAFIMARRGKLREGRRPFHEHPSFVAFLVLPILLSPAVVLLVRRRARLEQDRGFARRRHARRRALARLRAAKRHAGGAARATCGETVEALVEYVADRFDRPAAGLTYEEMDGLLAARGVPEAPRRRLKECLDRCDFGRFAPEGARENDPAGLVAEAAAVVAALERAL